MKVAIVHPTGGAFRLQWRFIDGIAAKLDSDEMHAAQQANDAVRAYELVGAGGVRRLRGAVDARISPGASRQ